MFRTIAFVTLILAAGAGVILNYTAAIKAGKNFYELATLSDLGVAFLVWGQYPLAAAIITTLVIASGITVIATQKK